ncbi:hypothetical protein LOTGIDRAFT_154208 [Lottia gigantea]|uniref:Uncharacterized protein n=1 Tax=Lottia gigantea TaxID=225164 RepID=V4A2F7_LOTGI|nr:hypothetical protein LOTGIDRAFT_154208 [Lottia gigantea]ESO89125.1 hypothetical protein LOTGIDRAFT_154208 [Lottia gigantea]
MPRGKQLPDDVIERLVGLIRERPFIYDAKDDSHMDAQKMSNAWESIAKTLKVEGLDVEISLTQMQVHFLLKARAMDLKKSSVYFIVLVFFTHVARGIQEINVVDVIQENAPNGTLLGKLSLDSEESNLRPSDSTKELIDFVPDGATNTWKILLKTALDADYGVAMLHLYFEYEKRGHRDKKISIVILDVNDVKPQFLNQPYIANVPENAGINTVLNVNIEAKDPDNGHGGAVDFSFIDNTCTEFSLTPISGQKAVKVSLNGQLDFEQARFYECTLLAKDGGTPSLSSITSLYITVNDVQDEPPIFTGIPYDWNVDEQSSQGFEVSNDVKAVDGDVGVPNSINYTITDDCGGIFHIDHLNGRITLSTVPDRDSGIILIKNGVCRGQIKAQEISNQTSNSSTITDYTITIKDINDNRPNFTASRYQATIEENMPEQIPLQFTGMDMSVEDKDQGTNSIFNLTLLTLDQYFEVDPVTVNSKATVFIRVKNNTILDYETHKFLSIKIMAKETQTSDGKTSLATVNVTIQDANDNNPEFNSSFQTDLRVDENTRSGSYFADIQATDRDSGKFGQITYSINGGDNKFAIDPSNGTLMVNGDLDRELKSQYFITVEAKDGGNRRSSISLTVDLLDANDNYPVFQKDVYEVFVEENSNFTRIVQVTATDNDERDTVNSFVSYRIIKSIGDQLNNFAITTNGELVLTQFLDYEALPSGVVNISVIAEDHGAPRLKSNSTTIIITVTDKNECSPVFTATSYHKSVPEDILIDSVILTVTANDTDGSEPNNQISFTIYSGSSDKFRINSQTGQISTAGSLDREDTEQYSLIIIATDRGSPSLSSNTTVNITITDVNDSPPIFPQREKTINVQENSTGSLAGLLGTDKDENSSLKYSIDYNLSQGIAANQQSVNATVIQNLVSIDNSNGSIVLNSGLDREKYRQIKLVITVEDLNAIGHSQTSTGSLIMNVIDVDDNQPRFNSKNYTASITENASQDIPITFISPNFMNAEDSDQGDNAKFEVEVRGDSGTFSVIPRSVTSLGSIVIKVANNAMLDFEQRESMSFQIVAKPLTRPNKPVTADVYIQINNVNEFAPQIVIHHAKPEIYENATPNTFVTQVDVYDNDTGIYGQFNLSLSGEYELFTIVENGSIYLKNASLDREKKSTYYLTIEALDTGGKRSTETIEVIVKDINDENPVFVKTEYTAILMEGDRYFTRDLVVQATDNDEVNTINSQITYSISVNAYSNNFTIDQQTGVISVQSPVDFEALQLTDNGTIHLNVTARDGGFPQLRQSTDVLIRIEDRNDFTPSFTHLVYNTSILETESSGNKVNITPVLKATDGDGSSPNNDVFYIIKHGGSDKFSINSTTGQIMVASYLDREETSSYQLIIEAVDRGAPSKTGTATVSIAIEDVNNKAPQFFPAFDTISVNETGDILTPLYTIKANDSDFNPELKYEMIWSNCYGFDEYQKRINLTYLQSLLQLSDSTGEIKLKMNLDRETIQQIMLRFKVTDGNGIPTPQTSTGSLVINVLDVNDNKPTFSMNNIVATVRENMPVGIPLTFSNNDELTVSDKDKDDNSIFELEIIEGKDIFEVVPVNIRSTSTVLIKIKNNTLLDYEEHHNFTVKILATEISTKERYNNTITISVEVLDSNDNDPVFTQNNYTGRVAENSNEDQFILNVKATDKDSGLYGNITYILQGGENKFKLIQNDSQASVVVKSTDLDREVKNLYYLTVLAVDEFGQGRRQTVPLRIEISDENDNKPIFRQSVYEGMMREGEVEFERSIVVKATDADNGKNSEVTYHMINNDTISNNFTVNSTTGMLLCHSPIDFELLDPSNQGKIRLYIVAQDKGTPKNTSDAQPIVLTVTDLNDKTPTFDHTMYNGSIAENSTEGTKVVKVRATDGDGSSPNNEVFYLIETGGSDNFRMNSSSGQITVGPGAQLDRDNIPNSTFWLTVLAVDRGTDPEPLSSSSTVQIFLTDINNKPPRFPFEIVSRNISESQTPKTKVYDFMATDQDTNSDLYYAILWNRSKAYDEKDNNVDISQIQGWFVIENKTGTIKVNSSLDREIAERVILYIFTEDKNSEVDNPKQTATGTLSIDIQDVNDNSPEIMNGNSILLNISESTSASTELTTLTATDKDKNQLVTFAINGTKYFHVSTNGKLTLIKVLDRENKDSHEFEVIATDNGQPSRSTIVPVTVNVLDFNDNPPMFNMSVTQFQVPENADNLTQVANVTTFDDDIGPNANVTYRLSGKDSEAFRIDSNSGEIFVDKQLNRESKDSYTFNIVAKDNPIKESEKSMKASQTITIIIDDINDCTPSFVHSEYTAVIPETMAAKSTISSISPALIKATDCDIGNNSQVIYTLADNQSMLFSVTSNGDQAKVVILKSLRGLAGKYNMTVIGQDKGIPALNSSTLLSIEIKDENINAPVFVKFGPIPRISEMCVQQHSIIYQFVASDEDKDKERNGKVKYRFDNDSALSKDYEYFDLDEDSGQMTLAKLLDHEVVKVLKIRIIAYDLGLPEKKSVITPTLTIKVNDTNDNPPSFNTSSVSDRTFEVAENTANPTKTIGRVEATDPDDDAIIFYSILASHSKENFRINSSSGEISVIKELDREQSVNPIVLKIQAEDKSYIGCDNSIQNFTTRTNVFIKILDENDNPPKFLKETLSLGFRSTSQYGYKIVDLKQYVTDNDTTKYSIHEYKQVGNLNIDTNIKEFQSDPILLTSNGTIFTNIKFETSTVGLISLVVKVSDVAGGDNLTLNLYVIGDKQVIKMTFLAQPEEVREFKEDLVGFISDVTGITFVPDELLSHVDDDGNIIKSSALDTHSAELQSIHSKYKVIEVYKALKEKINNDDGDKKKEYILIAVIVCLVAILLITVFMFLRNFSGFKRKLKAAAIDVKSTGKKKVADISPVLQQKSFGKNNPLFEREEINNSSFDNISDRLDDNEVNGYKENEEVEEEITLDLYDEIDSTRNFSHQPTALLNAALRHHQQSKNGSSMQSPEIFSNPVYSLNNDINLDELETTEI